MLIANIMYSWTSPYTSGSGVREQTGYALTGTAMSLLGQPMNLPVHISSGQICSPDIHLLLEKILPPKQLSYTDKVEYEEEVF